MGCSYDGDKTQKKNNVFKSHIRCGSRYFHEKQDRMKKTQNNDSLWYFNFNLKYMKVQWSELMIRMKIECHSGDDLEF